jgi:hypothetical protein
MSIKLPRVGTKARQHLEFIGTGKTFSEIQRFIVELNGFNYDEKRLESVWTRKGVEQRFLRRYRGYYCTVLYGGWNQVGFFFTYCDKVGKLWALKPEVLAALQGA